MKVRVLTFGLVTLSLKLILEKYIPNRKMTFNRIAMRNAVTKQVGITYNHVLLLEQPHMKHRVTMLNLCVGNR